MSAPRTDKAPPPPALEQLPATAQRLYGLIKNFSKRKGYCWGEQKTLAKHMRVSVRTLGAALSALKSAGLVAIERTGRANKCRLCEPDEPGEVADQIGNDCRTDRQNLPIRSANDENQPYKSLNLEEYLEEGPRDDPAPEHPKTLEHLARIHDLDALPADKRAQVRNFVLENFPLAAYDPEAFQRAEIAVMIEQRVQEQLAEQERQQRITQLADKAAFLSGNAQSPAMVGHWLSHLSDLIGSGFTLEQLEEAIDAGKGPNGNRKSEPPWDFKRRLEGAAGKGRGAAADPLAGWRAAAASLA